MYPCALPLDQNYDTYSTSIISVLKYLYLLGATPPLYIVPTTLMHSVGQVTFLK